MPKIIGDYAPFVRSAYNYDAAAVSDETGLKCEDVSRAKQEFGEEVDINTIVRRFNLTGQLPQNLAPPSYEDFDDVVDFHSAMNIVRRAQEAFMEEPAEIRARFGNDPHQFLAFVHDPANYEEAVKLGIVNAKAPEASSGAPTGAPSGTVTPPTGGVAPVGPAATSPTPS